MTNEQLAEFIKQGGNDELIPILWERIRKLMYMKAAKVYCALKSRFNRCGHDLCDLRQNCYWVFLRAIEGYSAESGCRFTSYLSCPFRNVVSRMTGGLTCKEKQEPLNSCISLDQPLNEETEEQENLTLAETIADENAVDPQERVEQAEEYRLLHHAVDGLKPPMDYVINACYFEGKSLWKIGEELKLSPERVRQYKVQGLRQLRGCPGLWELYRESRCHGNTHAFVPPDRYYLRYY